MTDAAASRAESEPSASAPWARREAWYALELMALTNFAFAATVLSTFGDVPAAFLSRSADRVDVVLFALAVVALPVALVTCVGLGARWFGEPTRWRVQLALLWLLGGLTTWRYGERLLGWSVLTLALLGAAAGAVLVALRVRLPSVGSFLRLAGVLSLVFIVQFLLLSPTGALVVDGGGTSLDTEAAAAVDEALGDEGPPIVVIVFDALPTEVLLDGTGHIDGELYPNIARIAGDGTWYRNFTTVHTNTASAVPALLTGRWPAERTRPPTSETYPRNLFTALGGTYEIDAYESAERLCPEDLCPRVDGASPLPDLLGDAYDLWMANMFGREPEALPGAMDAGRLAAYQAWVDEQDFSPATRPVIHYAHVVLPHTPWEYLPGDGPRYQASHAGEYGSRWNDWDAPVGRQRQVLQTQAADELLGRLLARLDDAGTYDDTLVTIMADHGHATIAHEPEREATDANAEEILWAPFMVKEPGRSEGEISDVNVQSIDALPTLLDTLGVRVPWDLDGVPAQEAHRRPSGEKSVVAHERMTFAGGGEIDEIVPYDGEAPFEELLATDPVAGTGPLAVWQRTDHGGLVLRDVAGLRVGDPYEAVLDVEDHGHLTEPGDHPFLELTAFGDLPAGTNVAVAVNGRVAAEGPTVATAPDGEDPDGEGRYGGEPGQSVVHLLLNPDSFGDENDLDLYVVTGEPGDEVLHPVTRG